MRKRIALLLLTLVLTAPGCAAVRDIVIDAALHAVFDHDHDDDDRRERRRQRRGSPRRGC